MEKSKKNVPRTGFGGKSGSDSLMSCCVDVIIGPEEVPITDVEFGGSRSLPPP